MPQTRTGTKLTPKRLYSHGQIPGQEEEGLTPLVFHPQLKRCVHSDISAGVLWGTIGSVGPYVSEVLSEPMVPGFNSGLTPPCAGNFKICWY